MNSENGQIKATPLLKDKNLYENKDLLNIIN